MGLIEPRALFARHRLTVAAYYRMAETGVIGRSARVELIQGEVVDMAPIGTRHASAVRLLNSLLSAAAQDRAVVAVQDPLHLDDQSEPQPDLMLLRPQAHGYRQAHPTAADVLLLIEVSDTSVRYDREIKLPLYAQAGVPEVWIVDLDAGLLRCHRAPVGDEYTHMQALAQPGTLAVPGVPAAQVHLSGLFA